MDCATEVFKDTVTVSFAVKASSFSVDPFSRSLMTADEEYLETTSF